MGWHVADAENRKKCKKAVQNVEKQVSLELFLEVLDKYKESESEVIWEYSSHIDADLKNLDNEIAEYRKQAGLDE